MNTYPVWAEIDLNAIAHNTLEIRKILLPSARMMAVVKANAYGHGAAQVARSALQHGADMLGVARLDEAVLLRDAGIDSDILIFGFTPPSQASRLIDLNLTQTVFSFKQAEAMSDVIGTSSRKLKIHIKTDTGMGRLGIMASGIKMTSLGKILGAHFLREIESIVYLPGLEPEGIFTHFASADNPDKSSARKQMTVFLEVLDHLKRMGIEFRCRHAANSAAILEMPESHLDMARPGIALYGYPPVSGCFAGDIRLKPAMTWKTRIIHIKKVPRNFPVSYGQTYRTTSTTRIATVSVGYADGLNRRLSSLGHMLVRGKKAAIAGRICMDLTMLDIGEIPEARVNDEVVIIGRQDGSLITAEDVASLLETISYEILTSVSARVARHYFP